MSTSGSNQIWVPIPVSAAKWSDWEMYSVELMNLPAIHTEAKEIVRAAAIKIKTQTRSAQIRDENMLRLLTVVYKNSTNHVGSDKESQTHKNPDESNQNYVRSLDIKDSR
jgi:hypothetical protein